LAVSSRSRSSTARNTRKTSGAVIAVIGCGANVSAMLFSAGIEPGLELALGSVAPHSRFLQADLRILADRQLPLFAGKPVGEIPEPCA